MNNSVGPGKYVMLTEFSNSSEEEAVDIYHSDEDEESSYVNYIAYANTPAQYGFPDNEGNIIFDDDDDDDRRRILYYYEWEDNEKTQDPE